MSSKGDRPLAEAFKAMYLSPQAIEYAVVDAFADGAVGGNPAAVVLLSEWKDEVWLKNVALEFNLSETAYIVKKEVKVVEGGNDTPKDTEEDREEVEDKPDVDAKPEPNDDSDTTAPKHLIHEYDLRWFTPKTEVDLCGHATLASAHVLYCSGIVGKKDTIFFHTRSGLLSARAVGPEESDAQNVSSEMKKTPEVEMVELNFPWITTTPSAESAMEAVRDTLNNVKVVAMGKASNYLIVELESSEDVDKLQPKMHELLNCDSDGLIATAPGNKTSGFDFVSRCFFPKLGIYEDPVTGSAHSILGPYWSTKLEKNHLLAYQASKRGGSLALRLDKKIGRVYVRGESTIFMTGVIVK